MIKKVIALFYKDVRAMLIVYFFLH